MVVSAGCRRWSCLSSDQGVTNSCPTLRPAPQPAAGLNLSTLAEAPILGPSCDRRYWGVSSMTFTPWNIDPKGADPRRVEGVARSHGMSGTRVSKMPPDGAPEQWSETYPVAGGSVFFCLPGSWKHGLVPKAGNCGQRIEGQVSCWAFALRAGSDSVLRKCHRAGARPQQGELLPCTWPTSVQSPTSHRVT